MRICETIVKRHPTLATALDAASVPFQVCSGLDSCVRWRDDQTDREAVAAVWEADECMALMRHSTLGDRVSAMQAAAPGAVLILVGHAAGLERCASWLSLELGVSVRRAAQPAHLADVLVAVATALSRASAAPKPCEDFLHGLTASDALFNRTKPRDAEGAWLGALRQVLSDNAAGAVHAAYPSFRDLFHHLHTAPDAREALADVRVGQQRLGPCKARRVWRVLMATREEASDGL